MQAVSTSPTRPNRAKGAWMWTVLPLNAGIQGFSTMVPLYILNLGGTVVQVSLFTTLYNFVLIPSAVFWGRLTDRLGRRQVFFVVACAGSTISFVLMYLLPRLSALGALYAGLGVVVGAASTATNLLVMETSEKKSWMSSYSRLSLITNLGSIIGLAVGFVWTSVLPLSVFLVFCAVTTGISVVLSYYLVEEPVFPLESSQLTFHPLSYASRVYHGITSIFQHLVIDPPSPEDVLKTFRAIRAGSMTGRALLFLSTFFFTTASGLLNTAFTPFLVSAGVTDNEVFALSLVNVLVQTLAYRVVGRIVGRFGGVRIGSYALVGRTALYMGFAGVALVFVGFDLFVITTTLFAFVGVAYALWNSSTSVVLFSSLGEKTKQGNILGGYAALTALGTVAGSLATGYIAFYQGYSTTFSIAAALMLVSFFVLEASLRSLGYIGDDKESGRPSP